MVHSPTERTAEAADSTETPPARRRLPWRSPGDQPRYARPALLGIAFVAFVLFAGRLPQTGYNAYLAGVVRGMTSSWQGFLFGAADPGHSVTLDKIPGFLWPQAVLAKLFGFHPWVLQLPQVIEGVLCVLVLYRLVRVWAGVPAGLLAAGAFTLTPVTVGVFGAPAEDAALTLLLLLAAEACQRAVLSGRLRPLLWSGFWVGVAFQAKMLEAWAVLPAFGLTYLIAAPPVLRRRLRHLALAGVVTVAVSASWAVLVTLTPAAHRPYVDGTTNNSAVGMIVGYNFLDRFGGSHLGGVPQHPKLPSDPSQLPPGTGAGMRPGTAAAAEKVLFRALHERNRNDHGKMVGSAIASQTGWLYPMGLLALVLGVAWRRGTPRTDRLRAGHLLWGTWFLTFFLLFSLGSLDGHMYYLGVVAVSLAALSGAGTVAFWTAFREGGRRAAALPASIALSVAWAAWIAWRFPSFRSWLGPSLIVLGAGALAVLALLRRSSSSTRRPAAIAAAVVVLTLLLGPVAWVSSVLEPGAKVNSEGAIGPVQAATGSAGIRAELGAVFGMGATSPSRGQGGSPSGGGPSGSQGPNQLSAMFGFAFGGGSSKFTDQQRSMLEYLRRHRDGARYLFASVDWRMAAPAIVRAGAPALPMGGFTGNTPFPSLRRFQRMVSDGDVHFVVLSGQAGGPGIGANGTPVAAIADWVRRTCVPVPASAYGAADPGATVTAKGADPQTQLVGLLADMIGRTPEQLLYRCG
ncbi:glycosyltransferase family 39 protein [Actinoallomurus spadix]|uniref:Glycosyltransferase family 39 protein n=1 Tax=Actinoallomurus spadix TaxID=79912 RepID=A0ABP3GB81_9ACTN|nr:glycosyltransferase family 39 protein [Actinoallomurus spadix]MCO5990597.1 glycosyltransferase family 39 protein [Actinoallomurus spadix]